MPYGDEYTGLEQLVGANAQIVGENMHYAQVHGWPPAQLVGAPLALPPHPADMQQMPINSEPMGTLPYGGTPHIFQENPRNVRNYPLGFFQPAVPAAATVIVTARPQVIFRPRRLMVPLRMGGHDIAENFSILDIRIGKNSQLVSAEELPATIFSERSIESSMTLDTANIGHDISITVRNLDACSAHDFRATMFGASIE